MIGLWARVLWGLLSRTRETSENINRKIPSEWKPIPRIYPMRTMFSRSAKLGSSQTRTLKSKPELRKVEVVCYDVDHVWERECERG